MSKIYDEYLKLKKIDDNKLYLFKSGKFYIFIAEDCDLINEYVVLKKVKFTNNILKCGFPVDSLNDYMKVFNNHKLNIEIVDSISCNLSANIVKIIEKIDINNITPFEALTKLKEIKDLINEK